MRVTSATSVEMQILSFVQKCFGENSSCWKQCDMQCTGKLQNIQLEKSHWLAESLIAALDTIWAVDKLYSRFDNSKWNMFSIFLLPKC